MDDPIAQREHAEGPGVGVVALPAHEHKGVGVPIGAPGTAAEVSQRATGDREGEVTGTAPVPVDHEARLREVLPAFTGPLQQVPPMYSALKQGGEPL